MEPKKYCKVEVPDQGTSFPRFHQCTHELFGKLKDGTPACKFHIAAEKRKLDKREKAANDYKRNQNRNTAAVQHATALTAGLKRVGLGEYGARGEFYFPQGSFQMLYTGMVIVNPALIDRIIKAREDGDWN